MQATRYCLKSISIAVLWVLLSGFPGDAGITDDVSVSGIFRTLPEVGDGRLACDTVPNGTLWLKRRVSA